MGTAIVTGGAGFIGSHLCKELLAKGFSIKVVDLNTEKKLPTREVEYIQGDCRDPNVMKPLIAQADAVYHFAATVSVPVCQNEPFESYSNNQMATVAILEWIAKEKIKTGRSIKFLFAGSSVVYGSLAKNKDPRFENSPLAWPQSFYGAQKLGSEHAITLYREFFKIPSVVFRFFNVYGPGQDPKSPYSGVISIFSTKIRESKTIQLHGGGNQTRDFISVHDVARACAAGVDVPDELSDGKAINLGSGISVTIKELAEEMCRIAQKNVTLETTPPRPGDVLHSLSDISRAREVLKWSPKVSLTEGLTELLRN
ncbi:MAG: NAD-dependent epimerase/dehydratase family protein [Bacteriovoracia bacterium]